MPKLTLTPEQIAFIHDHYMSMTSNSMDRLFKVGDGVVYRYMRKNNLFTPKEVSFALRADMLRNRTSSNPETDMIIREKYLKIPSKTLAKQIGRSDTFLRTRLRQLGLTIPPDLIEKWKKDSQIVPGNIPHNKGKPMPKEVYMKAKDTMFFKGHLPANTLTDGAITIRNDHPDRAGGRKCQYIRTSKGKWVQLNIHRWTQKNGPIPKGMVLRSKDGNTMNSDPENWELISKKENMKLNTLYRYPEEIWKMIHINSKLSRQINKIRKNNE